MQVCHVQPTSGLASTNVVFGRARPPGTAALLHLDEVSHVQILPLGVDFLRAWRIEDAEQAVQEVIAVEPAAAVAPSAGARVNALDGAFTVMARFVT
jgi:hypothetical protein